MSEIEADSEIDFVRKLVGSILWNMLYHEERLAKLHPRIACIRAILERGYGTKINFNALTFDDYNEDDDYPDEMPKSDAAYIRNLFASELYSLKHHEDELNKSHKNLAFVKALLARGNYTEVDIEELKTKAARRLAGTDDATEEIHQPTVKLQ